MTAQRNATVNPDTTILLMEFDTEVDALTKEITRIAVSHDGDIVVKEA